MVDVVNSSLVGAVNLRSAVQDQSGPQGQAASSVQSGGLSTPRAPFISPVISLDTNYNKAVLQIRNAETGDVEQQFPTRNRLAELRQDQARQDRAREAQQQESVSQTNAQSVQALSSELSFEDQSISQVQPASQSLDIVTVQEVTSPDRAANAAPTSTPQVAVAALSAGAQSGQSAVSSNVSVLA